MNNDVSLAGAFLAGLVSFLSPCVLPLVPGYISMLSGIGMERLRQGEVPRSGLFSSALAFVAGLSLVFISFGASASAVGHFLLQNRTLLAPIAGAFIIIFGLHLLSILVKLSFRNGMILGAILAIIGIVLLVRHAALFGGLRGIHFLSLSLVGFLGPSLTRWLNRDVRLHNEVKQPGIWSGFLLGFAFAFGWTPCIGPILTAVLTIAAASDKIGQGVILLAFYSAGLSIPFLLTALGIGKFMTFYKNFRKYLHAVELFSGALLLFIGGLVFLNRLTWLTGKLDFLNALVRYLERVSTTGYGPVVILICISVLVAIFAVRYLLKNWSSGKIPGKKLGGLVRLLPEDEVKTRLLENHSVEIVSDEKKYKPVGMANENLSALPSIPHVLLKIPAAVSSPNGRKTALIVATVVVLIIGTHFVDKATMSHPKVTTVSAGAPSGQPNTIDDAPDIHTPAVAPELTLKDLDDKEVSLASLKGKVVLVNFWATWCEPCRIEIPWLIDMQAKYSGKGFTILGIAMDEEGKKEVAPFVARERFDVNGQKLPMSYPIVIGNEDAANKFGGLFGYPTSVLISRDGKVIKRITGLISYDEISKAIESQL